MNDRIRLQRKHTDPVIVSNPLLVASEQKYQPAGAGSASSSHDLSRISPFYQAKLSISQPGDTYEREADTVAQKVMQMGDSSLQQQQQHQTKKQVQTKPMSELITHQLHQKLAPPNSTQQPTRLSIEATDRHLIQCGKWHKTTPHDRNYEKRVNKLTAPLTLDTKQQKYKDKALAQAQMLDDSLATKSYRYAPYTKKKGGIHVEKLILEAARQYYKYLDKLGAMKEHTRWFERTDKKGRSMKAFIIPGKVNLLIGSNTGDTVEGYFYDADNLNHRKNSSGSALYIKGHLLNDHLGGSGRSFNLVPLTAEKSKTNKTGSNDANGIHNKQVEEPIKKLVEQPGQVESIKYKVESLPPSLRSARPQTKIVEDFATEFDRLATANPTEKTNQIRDRVVLADARFDGGVAQQLITAVGMGNSVLPTTLVPILKANAELWKLEDEKVPYGISCSAVYIDKLSSNKEIPLAKDGKPITNYFIPNVLPSLYTAPYKA